MKPLFKKECAQLWSDISPYIVNLWRHENRRDIKTNRREFFQGLSPYTFEQLTFNGKVIVIWSLKFVNMLTRFQEIATTDMALDANLILEHILSDYRPNKTNKRRKYLLKYAQQEACAYYVVKNEDGSIKRILHLDLVRNIKPNPKRNNRPEFTGGLFHVLKHFSFNGKNLTYENDVCDVPDVFRVANLAGTSFAGDLRMISQTDKMIKYETNYPISETKMLWAYFSQEVESGVYFLDSLVVKSVKQTIN